MATLSAEAILHNGFRLLCVDKNITANVSANITLGNKNRPLETGSTIYPNVLGFKILRTAAGLEGTFTLDLVDERYLTYGGKMDAVSTATLRCKFPTYMRFDIEALGVPEGIDIILQMEEGFVIEGDYPNSAKKPLSKVTNLMTFRTPKKGSLYPSVSASLSIPGERRRPFSASITDAMSFSASGRFSPASGVTIDNATFVSNIAPVYTAYGESDIVSQSDIYCLGGRPYYGEAVNNSMTFTMSPIDNYRLKYFQSTMTNEITQTCDFERQIGPITADISASSTMSVEAERFRDVDVNAEIATSMSTTGQNAMVLVFDYVSAGTLQLPFDSTRQFSLYVDWGDGTITYHENEGGVVQHTYTSGGARTIGVWGNNLEKFSVTNANTTRNQWNAVREIRSWGEFAIEDMAYACKGLILTAVPRKLPTSVTTTNSMFRDASTFNAPEISYWGNGTANVTDMGYMFYNCSAFNQNINGWNTSSVTDMTNMFDHASVFNQPLNSWNVSNVSRMSYMFSYASWFNQDISSWNVGNVQFFNYMFDHAIRFNQPLNSWNVSKVVNFNYMFSYAEAFNQDLNSWVTTGTVELYPGIITYTNMEYMFYHAGDFNGNITGWNMSNVWRTQGMFQDADSFNQDISGWDTSRISEMNYMFYNNNAFNQDLSGWCVSLISSKPTGFDTNATAWTLPDSRPVWGTCP